MKLKVLMLHLQHKLDQDRSQLAHVRIIMGSSAPLFHCWWRKFSKTVSSHSSSLNPRLANSSNEENIVSFLSDLVLSGWGQIKMMTLLQPLSLWP